jgi:hypothetical protein
MAWPYRDPPLDLFADVHQTHGHGSEEQRHFPYTCEGAVVSFFYSDGGTEAASATGEEYRGPATQLGPGPWLALFPSTR